jgi:hypothetical protein
VPPPLGTPRAMPPDGPGDRGADAVDAGLQQFRAMSTWAQALGIIHARAGGSRRERRARWALPMKPAAPAPEATAPWAGGS